MKTILLSITLLFMLSCASIPCKQGPCPPQDVYLLVEPGVPVAIPKGFLDNPGNYWTEEEFRKILEEKEMSI